MTPTQTDADVTGGLRAKTCLTRNVCDYDYVAPTSMLRGLVIVLVIYVIDDLVQGFKTV